MQKQIQQTSVEFERGNTLIETVASLALIAAIALSFAALAVRSARVIRALPSRTAETRCSTLSCAGTVNSSTLTCTCNRSTSPVIK